MMFRNQKRALGLLTAVILSGMSLIACTVSPGATDGASDSATSSAQPGDLREAPQDVGQATLSELVQGNNAFAFDLYQAARHEEGNLFFSPYSISAALTMAYAGARNNTEQQMATVLRHTLPQEQLHPAFNVLEHRLASHESDTTETEKPFILHIANSIWGQNGYAFMPLYLDLIARNYAAELRALDFGDESKRERAQVAINDWISEQTQGKIEDLIQKEMLTEFTRLVLANAVYFKADWEDPFLHGTRNDDFYLLDGTRVTVPMMSRRAYADYFAGEGYQALAIPYKGGRFEMVVLIPEEGLFDDIEGSLDGEFFDSLLRDLAPEDLKLYLPQFKYEASLTLGNMLSEMGMPDAFDENQADFSGIAEIPPILFISHVEHKAVVAVDELGTEAAAATGVVAEVASMPVDVSANRPFIFLIRDSRSGTLVFAGRVTNPTAH